jgi:hypothetical protein
MHLLLHYTTPILHPAPKIVYSLLTNIIVEPHERPYKLSISLHDDPDSGVNASVDEF